MSQTLKQALFVGAFVVISWTITTFSSEFVTIDLPLEWTLAVIAAIFAFAWYLAHRLFNTKKTSAQSAQPVSLKRIVGIVLLCVFLALSPILLFFAAIFISDLFI